MGVLLQGFYKKKPNNAVPSPADGDPSVPWWWDHLAAEANDLRKAGFTAVWLPPVLKTASGASPGADGYGVFDDYDAGSRHQKGSTPTRFGTREQLQRCVAILRANGLDVYLDMVEHQRSGDTTPFVFRYPGADGAPDIGRFPKDPSNFVPQVPRDPDLGGPVADDFPFGRELAPINALPHHYVFDNLIAASDWLTRALDAQGYRIDDVKGLSTDFLRPFLESKSMAGKFAVGEYFDGNQILVNGWIFNPKGMNGRASAFDFPLKFVLTAMCNNAGRFNMSDLDHAGLAGISPLSAVTFVENHDTDLNSGESVVFNKILGYAYILTSEGYPCVYYRDYDMGPDGYKLKPHIDDLIWIHEKLAAGTTQQRFKDFDVFAYERMGGPHLLVGLNNDPGGPRTITVATGFGRNVTLHDYTGHAPNAVTDGNGNVTLTIPKNENGFGYVCYSVDGQSGGFEVTTRAVTQDFEGADDLDILPTLNGKPVQAGSVWCAANSAVHARLKPVTTGWTNATAILLEMLAPDGSVLARESFTLQTPAGGALQATTRAEGFHGFRLTASNTPASNPNPAYTLSVTYTAPTVFGQPATVEFQAAALAQGADAAEVGQWSAIIPLSNVPIHTHVLPTGKVLFWGRRNPPGTATAPPDFDFPSLNQHATHAFIWDPANPLTPAKPTSNQPTDSQGNSINLFCSGHTFLQDGRLLVTGGHLFDSQGLNATTFYDPAMDEWSAGPAMNQGRWYPTAVTLPDGRAFVCSGQFPTGPLQPPPNATSVNNISQVLENGVWNDLTNFTGLPLFPRFHVAPNGNLFMSGPLATSYYFENVGHGNPGTWVPIASRSVNNADYAPSVMYDVGKVVFIGGGGGTDGGPLPANIAETIDLNAPKPSWAVVAPMKFHRRQHNATLLADGTVFVTGGSQASGFDSLGSGQPVHTPELWDPHTGTWTQMAPEAVDRCYHSTAVLLPDGRVLSGGGGEYAPVVGVDQGNPPVNTHANAQLFSPPYLFRGARPTITSAPANVEYGQAFEVGTPAPNEIGQVTWIRLSSVTHSFDQNQRINFLAFQRGANKVTVTAPANGNVCPPGHYMLFLLNLKKVPSIATIIQITAGAAAPRAFAPAVATFHVLKQKTPLEQDADIQTAEKQPPVVVGVTPGCPYGISACWGGAYESLTHMHGVRLVRPVPNAEDSTAFVYLEHDGLPDLDAWSTEFARVANGTHVLRGVEVTVTGLLEMRPGGSLVMDGNDVRPPLLLQPMEAADKIQWDASKRAPQPLEPLEQDAYPRLLEQVKNAGGSLNATITGPLRKTDDGGYVLEVREFSPGQKN
ncbi:MAG: galactose oxidase-like domain-containing protein [Mycobacterium sp.]|uniref:galactose oxidase-like domain-containing protein n=1 Tax=Mycobacterium sp. TaxID=1785 RepID=UPI003F96576C